MSEMFINSRLLPFDVTYLVKNKAWREATPEQRQKFISAGTAFNVMINHYAHKYQEKGTLKGEFIACVLWDFYFDLLELDTLDCELEHWYDNVLDEYSDRLLDEAVHAKRWIKVLKKAYRENKKEIKQQATNEETGEINIDSVNDFSVEYRDYLY